MFRPGVAVITGGGGAIGRACAQVFAEGEMTVAVLDLVAEAAAATAAGLPGRGHLSVSLDVSDRAAIRRALDQIRGFSGEISVLVNCAGLLAGTSFLRISDEEWTSVLDASLTGSFILCQEVVPDMIESRYGRIINISSTAGKTVSTLGGAHYTTAKTGLLGLTRAIAKETAAFGVTVNAVCPGLIDTPMARKFSSPEQIKFYQESFPIPRLGTAQEVAELVGFLASEEAGYITGASFDINGGDLMV